MTTEPSIGPDPLRRAAGPTPINTRYKYYEAPGKASRIELGKEIR
ncbi:hypothetical protein O1W68_08630 [Rhodococcus sp. H36-A4]|nr:MULTISPECIES: hypothetical protein [unclassified Rhodococcus (in: high G+C Gram-positive bacteria)]MCZ4078001.1 hypothetical protein [Rhodococcus sp. H36-A4]MDJ0359176.1 hypothetical protein [Rhodococcus sp. H29-C3]